MRAEPDARLLRFATRAEDRGGDVLHWTVRLVRGGGVEARWALAE